MLTSALRKRLTLQSESLVSDGAGGRVGNWTTVATVWGKIEPVSGYHENQAGNRYPTHTITIRNRSDLIVSTGMRLLYGSRVFTIRRVTQDEAKARWLYVTVEEGGQLG